MSQDDVLIAIDTETRVGFVKVGLWVPALESSADRETNAVSPSSGSHRQSTATRLFAGWVSTTAKTLLR